MTTRVQMIVAFAACAVLTASVLASDTPTPLTVSTSAAVNTHAHRIASVEGATLTITDIHSRASLSRFPLEGARHVVLKFAGRSIYLDREREGLPFGERVVLADDGAVRARWTKEERAFPGTSTRLSDDGEAIAGAFLVTEAAKRDSELPAGLEEGRWVIVTETLASKARKVMVLASEGTPSNAPIAHAVQDVRAISSERVLATTGAGRLVGFIEGEVRTADLGLPGVWRIVDADGTRNRALLVHEATGSMVAVDLRRFAIAWRWDLASAGRKVESFLVGARGAEAVAGELALAAKRAAERNPRLAGAAREEGARAAAFGVRTARVLPSGRVLAVGGGAQPGLATWMAVVDPGTGRPTGREILQVIEAMGVDGIELASRGRDLPIDCLFDVDGTTLLVRARGGWYAAPLE